MSLIYKLMHRGEEVGGWPNLQSTEEGVRAYLAVHGNELERLRLVGFLSSYERGATPAFAIVGADIPTYIDAAAAVLMTRTEADDATEAVAALPSEQREAILDLLRPAQRRHVQALLGYEEVSAGTLMSEEFICLYDDETADQAIARLRSSHLPSENASVVFVVDQHQGLNGIVMIPELLRADPGQPLRDLYRAGPSVSRAAHLEEIARVMADQDSAVIAVVDDRERPLGVVTVDDVLELLLPARWRPSRRWM